MNMLHILQFQLDGIDVYWIICKLDDIDGYGLNSTEKLLL